MSELTDRIIAQYYESTKIRAIINDMDVLIKENMNDALSDLKVQMGINATGYWLELLGKRFKFPRPLLTDPDGATYFGLVEDGISKTNKGSFSAVPFVGDNESLTAGRVEASNEMYSALLGLVISSMRTDGSQDSIAKIVNSFFDGSSVVDNQDMSFTVNVHVFFQMIPVSVTVSGTGTTADGTWQRYDDVNGKCYFKHPSGFPYVAFATDKWRVGSEGGAETWYHPTGTGYTPPLDGYTPDQGGLWPTVVVNSEEVGNDINILRDNMHLIPKPAGVSLELIPFNYFGFDNNESSFDSGIFA